MKRFAGMIEVIFDVFYLTTALILGGILIFTGDSNNIRIVAGIMAFVLASGDGFHLLPRIKLILTGKKESLTPALGRGKQITSVTMTIFYLLLWEIGQMVVYSKTESAWSILIYLLAGIRIILCLLPQNKWKEVNQPLRWGIWRNIPFFLLGIMVAGFFFIHRNAINGLEWIWLAILLSFAFYLPVVLWSKRNPKLGMLMLPKSCAYLWMLIICLSL
jgi:hypothetical protein